MYRLAQTLLPVAIACTILDVAPAAAQPTPRDHRTQEAPSPPPSGPEARDHRTQPAPSSGQVRYRRRPGPRFMMPLRVDIGLTTANTDAGFLTGLEVRAGIHWASLSPQPTNIDVGLGLFGAILPGPENATVEDDDDSLLYGGAYLEGGATLSRGRNWRTWGTGRGEWLGRNAFGEEKEGFGVAGRLTAELYLSGVGIEPRGVFLGTYAIGVYLEGSLRALGSDVNPLQVSAGLTFRTPLVFAP